MAKKEIKRKIKRMSYKALDGNFTQIANTMFKYIPNGNNCYFINFIIDETEYEVKKQPTAIELFGKDIYDEDVEVLTEEEYNNMYKKPPRKEIVFLDKLEGVIGKIGIRQYRVFNYRIDYYIPNLNIAIEYDENDHKNYTYEQQEGRQKKIEKELGCRFIRISDKNTDEFNIDFIISNL